MSDETLYQKLVRENVELRAELRKMLIIVEDEFPDHDDRHYMAIEIAKKYSIDIEHPANALAASRLPTVGTARVIDGVNWIEE